MTKIYFKTILIFCIIFTYIYSCKKIDYSSVNKQNTFTIKEAKDWWKNIFAKSAACNEIDMTSEIAVYITKSNIGSIDKELFAKRPNWEKAFAYNIGKFALIEAPLIYKNRLATINTDKNATNEEKHKIAQAKLDKLILIKDPNGKIEVRIMTIAAAYQYLKSKNYDISHIKSNYFDADFSGSIQIRRWNEKVISKRLVENGKVTTVLKPILFKPVLNNRTGYEIPDCPPSDNEINCENGNYIALYAHVCTNYDDFNSEGLPNPTVAGCGHWSGENTFVCIYFQCNLNNNEFDWQLYCDTQNLIPLEACLCAYWDISYCDNNDNNNNNDPPQIDPCDVANELKNDSLFKKSMQELDPKVTEAKEYGQSKDKNGVVKKYVGTADAAEIEFNVTVPLEYLAHTHGTRFGYNLLPTFSPDDFLSIYKLNSNSNLSSDLFTFSVITAKGSFILTINDRNKMVDFLDKYFYSDNDSDKDKFNERFMHYDLENNNLNYQQLIAKLTSFLKDEDSGLSLLIPSNSYSQFSKSEINNSNQNIISPCN